MDLNQKETFSGSVEGSDKPDKIEIKSEAHLTML